MPLRLSACRLLLLLAAAAAASAAGAAAAEPNTNSSANCTIRDGETIRTAFAHVANFPLPLPGRRACRPLRRLPSPSRNLTGAVGWADLASLSSLLTVDLSGNSLRGAIDAAFWRAPSLRAVDVSRNHLDGALRFDDNPSSPTTAPRLAALNVSGNAFTSVDGVAALAASLVSLDVSRNAIRTVPEGLRDLARVQYLDLSWNNMSGRFSLDLPPLDGLVSLNISYNNFSGTVDAAAVRRFGASAFFHAGDGLHVAGDDDTARSRRKRKRAVTTALISAGAAVATLAFSAACVACGLTRRRWRKKKKKDGNAAAAWEDEEVAVGAVRVAAAAPVVVLERPLMELTLADLAAATSGFGRDSQLAEAGGRSGAAYRAVLPGDLHVVVRVVEGPVAGVPEDGDEAATAAGLRELARLRHPNILPLFGYCIAGNQKLLLFEYMEKGDLHRWLHELPVGSMDTEDIGIDTMQALEEDRKPAGDWATRYRIILGIARGLAFLHQGWAGSSGRPIVHGHLVPTNVLLGDDMEPRISDFLRRPDGGGGGGGEEAPEADVYRFGALVFELVSGQARWTDASTSWARGVIRNKKGLNLVDDRLRDEAADAEREMAECLQVGFLCTASAPEKRPTMQQVVGLLKDIRPAPPGAG